MLKIAATIFLLLGGITTNVAEQAPRQVQFNGGQMVHKSACPPVPETKSLLFNCGSNQDIITINKVVLTPNPPVKGKKLTVNAIGYLSKDLVKGAYVQLGVKYGIIKVADLKIDLCEKLGEVGINCPLEKGVHNITASVELPGQIPMGYYFVDAVAKTKDEEQLTHLQIQLQFPF